MKTSEIFRALFLTSLTGIFISVALQVDRMEALTVVSATVFFFAWIVAVDME